MISLASTVATLFRGSAENPALSSNNNTSGVWDGGRCDVTGCVVR